MIEGSYCTASARCRLFFMVPRRGTKSAEELVSWIKEPGIYVTCSSGIKGREEQHILAPGGFPTFTEKEKQTSMSSSNIFFVSDIVISWYVFNHRREREADIHVACGIFSSRHGHIPSVFENITNKVGEETGRRAINRISGSFYTALPVCSWAQNGIF